MSTEFINDQWRLPNNENKDKQSNYSMDFDGSSQYVDLGDDDIFSFGNSTNDSPFSISAWIYMDSTTNFRILAKYDAPNYEYQFDVGGSSNLRFFIFDGTSYRARIGSTLSINQWYHVVATYNGVGGTNAENGIKIYVDGVEITGTTSSNGSYTAMHNTTAPVYIGRIASSYANGKIDGVSIFNYELSSSQITTLYGSSSTGIGNPMSLSPKPVASYNLGDKSAFNGSSYLTPNVSLKDFVFNFDNENISSNNFIDINSLNSNILNSSFSIGIWIKKEVKPSFTDNDRIIDLTVDANTSLQIICDNGSQKFGINFILSGVSKINQQVFNSFTASANVWNQIVLTWDGSSYVYYFNGQPVTSTATELIGVGGTGFFLGKRADGLNTTFFNGEMSNVQIFNTALPATGSNSVETLYNNGSPLTSMTGFSSLVSWWKLDASDTYDSSTGNWTIEDHAGSNDGTSSGMTQANLVASDLSFKTSISPFALDFDSASSDYIDCGNDSSLNMADNGTDSFTFSFWIKRSSTNNEIIISKQVNSGSYNGFETSIISNKIRVFLGSFQSPQAYLQVISTNTITGTDWKNIVITYDGSQNVSGFNIYINKVSETLVTLKNITPSGVSNSANFQISGRVTTTLFSGSLSNVSYWNTDLTSSQVSEIYSEGIPQNLLNHSAVSSLVSWWQLGSNSSFNTNWTVLDEKGSNNGTSVNMGEDAIVDGVGSYANGLSYGMGGDEIVGNAFGSSANSLSINMDVLDRVEDTPA